MRATYWAVQKMRHLREVLLHSTPLNIGLRRSRTLSLSWYPLFAGWSFVQGTPATFGPVFEEQPVGLLFPEESTEDQVTLACRARASPPATYR